MECETMQTVLEQVPHTDEIQLTIQMSARFNHSSVSVAEFDLAWFNGDNDFAIIRLPT